MSDDGIVVCSKEHRWGDCREWEHATQAVLTAWAKDIGPVRCDNCGKALDRNTRRREERIDR